MALPGAAACHLPSAIFSLGVRCRLQSFFVRGRGGVGVQVWLANRPPRSHTWYLYLIHLSRLPPPCSALCLF